MRLSRISVQNFRNVAFAELELAGRRQFFVGKNGQGKTNLIEAIGFLGALRSFRGADVGVLLKEGETEAAVSAVFEHEKFGETRVLVKLKKGGKEVWCDGERVARLGDYLGRFATVVLSSQDQQLIRGGPSGRRRWMDLVLSAGDGEYLRALQGYHRALAERGSLLRRQGAAAAEFEAFERVMSDAAAVLSKKRSAGVERLSAALSAAYRGLAGAAEAGTVELAANVSAESAEEWLAVFGKNRARDLHAGATLSGAHRDDLVFKAGGILARDFGSEGQQRCLSIALRLAEADYLREVLDAEPVLLVDDVLGELDAFRREHFWEWVNGRERQLVATGTSLPEGDWAVSQVEGGRLV